MSTLVVILCCLPEKGRKEIEETIEKTKERDREERATRLRNESEETEQEAHGPRFAHLSDIATADMQMLWNIFPILSSQLMKISSFEQFLVLKKNIWA